MQDNRIGKVCRQRYEPCNDCKNQDDFELCEKCTSFAGTGAATVICGVPTGLSGYYMHSNFAEKESASHAG